MNDEGFREIQLNGKQLVFLFMAATVVSVVIFLCGVLVGREFRPDRAPGTEAASVEITADPGARPAEPSTPPPSASSAAPASGAPPVPADELTYPDRLQRNTPPEETLKPAPPVQEPLPAQRARPAAAKPSPPPSPPTAAALATSGDPSGPGYAVQVAAPANREEAAKLAKQLIAKGYPAFVMDPVKGAPRQLYRVRVGKYRTRKEAEEISARLKAAEQFDPWIAR